MRNDVKYLLICLWAICTSFLKCLIKTFAQKIKVWFGLDCLTVSPWYSHGTWQVTGKPSNLPAMLARKGQEAGNPVTGHVWKVVIGGELSYFLTLHNFGKKLGQQRGDLSAAISLITLGVGAWLWQFSLCATSLAARGPAMVRCSVLICRLGITVPCRSAGRRVASKTLPRTSALAPVKF